MLEVLFGEGQKDSGGERRGEGEEGGLLLHAWQYLSETRSLA